CHFRFSPDQRCQSSGLSHIETPPRATFLEDAVHVEGLSHTSKRVFAQFLALEIALDQPVGGSTDSYGVGLRQSLDARTNVGDLTKCQLLLSPLTPHRPNHDQTRMDPYTQSELDAFLLLQTGITDSTGFSGKNLTY